MAKLDLNEIKKYAITIEEPDFSYINNEYLRKFRIDMKMSQSLLADYLGVSKKAIEKWEQGKNRISPVVIRMVYLIEKDPDILKLLKKVSIGESAIELNAKNEYKTCLIKNMVSYEEKIIATNNYLNNWKMKQATGLGGLEYVQAGI